MASNDNNGKHKLEEESESSTSRKRLRLSDDDTGDNNSSDLPEEETEEEVSSEEMLTNQLDTSEEKLMAKSDRDIIFQMTATPPHRHRSHTPPKVVDAPMRTAAMTTKTSGCRYKSRSTQ
jgi:hypothetical protein